MNILFGLVTAALAGTDLWCKKYVEEHFTPSDEKQICNEKIVFRKRHNKGFAMNLGEEKPEMVRTVSGVVGALTGIYGILIWLKEVCPWKKLGASMVLAGAISNTYDRIKRKYVVDYFGFKTKWEKLNRITFNLADMFIFVGSGLLIVAEVLGGIRKKR